MIELGILEYWVIPKTRKRLSFKSNSDRVVLYADSLFPNNFNLSQYYF
jgi:hypothetical protein